MEESEASSSSAVSELAEFLTADTRVDVLRSAVAYVVGLSASEQGAAIFRAKDFAVGRALCSLVDSPSVERSTVFSALTNFASMDVDCGNFMLDHTDLVDRCCSACRKDDAFAVFPAKLLSNLSIQFSAKVYEKMVAVWESVIADTIELLNKSSSLEYVDYLGYVLVNCTSLPQVRRHICEKHLARILPLIAQSENTKRRLIAVDVVRNLCFDDENHELLLNADDEFLATLVTPLADANDELDDEEIQKLPLQLQYFDGQRCKDELIVLKLIEALYQLCATKFGRKVLREKGIYAILRELDKSATSGGGVGGDLRSRGSDGRIGGRVLVGASLDAVHESTLHALIGVLIRYESEMQVDSRLSSIRHLE